MEKLDSTAVETEVNEIAVGDGDSSVVVAIRSVFVVDCIDLALVIDVWVVLFLWMLSRLEFVTSVAPADNVNK